MELYQIILSVSGIVITALLAAIGFFLDNLFREGKENNKSIIKEIKLVQTSISEIKTKVAVQEEINEQLKNKDDEIWEELKAVVGRINDLHDKNTLFTEELKLHISQIKEIMLNHINNNLLHKEQIK